MQKKNDDIFKVNIIKISKNTQYPKRVRCRKGLSEQNFVKEVKPIIDNWDFIKLKSFSIAKDHNQVKKKSTTWE